MPHIILEYSVHTGLKGPFSPFFIELNTQLGASGIVELERLKSRAVEHLDTVVGDSATRGFIFLSIALLEGRSEEQRRRLTDIAQEVLQSWLLRWKVAADCSVTIEIREMERSTHKALKVLPNA